MLMEDKKVYNYEIRLRNGYELRLGTHVWLLQGETVNVNRKCTVCGGEKSLTVKGYTFKCPKCNGRTTGELWYSYRKFKLIEAVVDEVTFSLTALGHAVNVKFNLKYLNTDVNNIWWRNKDAESYFGGYEPLTCEKCVEKLNKSCSEFYFVHDLLFTEKSEAVATQRYFNKYERQRVAKYETFKEKEISDEELSDITL